MNTDGRPLNDAIADIVRVVAHTNWDDIGLRADHLVCSVHIAITSHRLMIKNLLADALRKGEVRFSLRCPGSKVSNLLFDYNHRELCDLLLQAKESGAEFTHLANLMLRSSAHPEFKDLIVYLYRETFFHIEAPSAHEKMMALIKVENKIHV